MNYSPFGPNSTSTLSGIAGDLEQYLAQTLVEAPRGGHPPTRQSLQRHPCPPLPLTPGISRERHLLYFSKNVYDSGGAAIWQKILLVGRLAHISSPGTYISPSYPLVDISGMILSICARAKLCTGDSPPDEGS